MKLKIFFVVLNFLLVEHAYANPQITFIALHPGPKAHFTEFVEVLSKKGLSCQLLSEPDIPSLVSKSMKSAWVIVEGGNLFMQEVIREMHKSFSGQIGVYYDNPEPYVPGGYSIAFSQLVREKIEAVLFANANLVEEPIFSQPNHEVSFHELTKWGIGYFPLANAERLRILRGQKKENFLFSKPLLLYIGGANSEYYEEAFPAFLQFLSTFSTPTAVLLQQHPRARLEGNRDLCLLEQWQGNPYLSIQVSNHSLEEAAALADAICYHQTSSVYQFIWAGVPTYQVGPCSFYDLLVRKGWITSVTDSSQITYSQKKPLLAGPAFLQELGYRPEWKERLIEFFCFEPKSSLKQNEIKK